MLTPIRLLTPVIGIKTMIQGFKFDLFGRYLDRRELRRMSLLNKTDAVPHIPKLSQVLFERREHSFNSLAALPSNVEAIDAALKFAAGLNPFVVIVGPSGWGKTHLLNAIAQRLAHDLLAVPEILSVSDYVSNTSRVDISGPLLLDDVQEAMGRSRMKMSLRLNLERRVKCNKQTILAFTSPKPSRALKAFLPSARDWTIVSMGAAEPAERLLLLDQMSTAEGLALSPRLTKVMADQMLGNGLTLAGALKRLRLSGTNWLDSNATLRALGLLDPFFADNSSWDLKHKVLRVAEHSKFQFSKVSSSDLALYTMLHEAGLNEIEVARATGVEPAEAYLRASKFKARLADCETSRVYVKQFVDLVVEELARD